MTSGIEIEKAITPKGFFMYLDNAEDIFELTDNQAGKLFKMIFSHELGIETVEHDPIINAVFRPIRRKLDSGREKYVEKVSKNRINASKGGKAKAERYRDAIKEKSSECLANASERLANTSERVANLPNTNTSTNTSTNTNTNTNTNTSTNIMLDDFNEFWENYPRKVEKSTAEKNYLRRRKEGHTKEDLLSACRNYANAMKKTKTEEKFIKHPSTFLSAKKPFIDYITVSTKSNEPDYSSPLFTDEEFKEYGM